MTIYNAKEMCDLADSKSRIAQEKEGAMEQIYETAQAGRYCTVFRHGDFEDYRLIIAWLCELGYRCQIEEGGFPRRFYVKWEK